MRDTQVEPRRERALLADTPWMEIPEPILERILSGAAVRNVPARGAIFRLGDQEPRAAILLAGTARAFLAAADGRQLTVRYPRRGALLARRSVLVGGHSPVAIHAVTDVTVLELDALAFLRLVETVPSVARVVLGELSRRLEEVHATVADSAFGTVRERLARHLLALTDHVSPGDRRIASITQQELADGIGTMREVVARALRDLREEGIVATEHGAIEILDSARLADSLGAWQVAAAALQVEHHEDVEALLEATPSAIVAVGPGGEIAYVNGLAEATFGWPRAELIGRKVELLLPERLAGEHVRHRADFLADPVARPVYLREGLRARRRDGTEFPVFVGLSVIETHSGTLILASIVANPVPAVPA